jgi:hypothetical protein
MALTDLTQASGAGGATELSVANPVAVAQQANTAPAATRFGLKAFIGQPYAARW